MSKARVGTRTEFYAYTRQRYSKSGALRIETTIRAITRSNLTGRIVSSTSGKFLSQQEASAFIQQIKAGELSGSKASAILRSRSGKSHPELVKSGARSIVQLFEDRLPVSDYDRDRLAYLFNQMDWQDFEEFYNQNSDAVKKIYRVGSPRARDRDSEIVMPTAYERDYAISDFLDRLQNFLNIDDTELARNVNRQNYNTYGARKKGKSVPRFAQWLYS